LGGERDLSRLLQNLKPKLCPERYTFTEAAEPILLAGVFALVREDEGLTAIQADPRGAWAKISLQVHSSLEAVGLTGVLTTRLAELGISANVVAGLNHDHLFVPWDRREEALACLQALESER